MNSKSKKQFSTPDFYIASFCVAKGLKLAGVERENPRRILFVFDDTEDREGLIEDFLFGRTTVEPKAFVTAIKELKQLLHSNP